MGVEKYSVLMSIYAGEEPEYFKESLESMIRQSMPADQIVIVKDGQLTPQLNNVIYEYLLLYPDLFTVVTLEKNVGLGLALNEGLKKCRNELVARMDTDDISVKERCEIQVKEFINNNKLSIIGSIIDEFEDDPQQIKTSRIVPLKHDDILKFSKRRNPFNHPTVMYKRSEVLAIGGYGDYRRNQDLDLFVRMLNEGLQAMNINQGLVLFRANSNNLERRKSWKKCKGYISMIYNFWRKGYSSLFDLIVVAASQIVVILSPLWLLDWISRTFLREVKNK